MGITIFCSEGGQRAFDPRPLPTISAMKKFILAFLVLGLYAAHQDIWFWTSARPLVFGFLPIGLFYHAAYSVAACLLMIALVKLAWPEEISRAVDEELRSGRRGEER